VEKTGSFSFQQGLREAYLAYRLNQSELSHLVGRLQQGEASEQLKDLFEQFSRRDVDWREQDGSNLPGALAYLGLDAEYAQLRPDQVWSGYQRALFRRLSQPEFDAPLQPSSLADQGDPQLVETITAHLDEWDHNHDTRLSADEVDRAMGEESDPARAAALAILRRYQRGLNSCYSGDGAGFSRTDLNNFARHGIPGLPGLTASINQKFLEYQQRASQMKSPGPLFQENIVPEAIHQGSSGTCVFLSTALGRSGDQLRGMLQENGDATFTIHFADGENETVQDLSVAERLFHARGEGEDRWPALLEMAMAQRLFREKRPQDGSLRSAVDGVEPEEAVLALTGTSTEKTNLDELSLDQTRELLARVTRQSGPVFCATRPDALSDFISYEDLHNGLVNSHCYALVGYDAEKDQVLLQNPWHHGEWRFQNDGNDDGRFAMSTTEFYCSYRWLARSAA
jgi:hypothetical protein